MSLVSVSQVADRLEILGHPFLSTLPGLAVPVLFVESGSHPRRGSRTLPLSPVTIQRLSLKLIHHEVLKDLCLAIIIPHLTFKK